MYTLFQTIDLMYMCVQKLYHTVYLCIIFITGLCNCNDLQHTAKDVRLQTADTLHFS